jgi:hypothetical protein
MLVMAQVQPDQMPPEVLEIVKIFFASVVVISLGIPIIRAFTRRFERGPQLPAQASPEVVARLERIEQAVETVAVEVERIAEAQRFSAKLMAEQQRGLPRSDS